MARSFVFLSFLLFMTSCGFLTTGGISRTGVALLEERTAGEVIDDTTIWAQIKELYLQEDLDNLFAEVNVDVHQGRVLLTGAVKEPATRVEASVLAWQPKGVQEVINEIQISNTQNFKDYARDVAITAQVRARILFAKDVDSVNYTVDTVNSTVYLSGIANNRDELNDITKLASKVKGVRKVISHVKIKQQRN